MKNRILIIAAHPDDEVLGCGGTIARHADAADQVQVLIVAEGSTSGFLNKTRFTALQWMSVVLDGKMCANGPI